MPSRWVFPTRTEALKHARVINKRGIRALLNYLPEELRSKKQVEDVVKEYIELSDKLERKGMHAGLSIKLTSIGLLISEPVAKRNLQRILRTTSLPVWIDMESGKQFKATHNIFHSLHKRHPNLGLTIRASLFASRKELRHLMAETAKVRLVRDTYKDPPKLGFTKRPDIERAGLSFLDRLAGRVKLAAASNDPVFLKLAADISPNIEIQYLHGFDSKMQKLSGRGNQLSEYIPYGPGWQTYVRRRKAYMKQKSKMKK